MRKYYIVKGKPGVLVGDPTAPGRFIGQRKLSFTDGYPKRLADRYEPQFAAAPKEPTILKAFANGSLEKVKEVVAGSLGEVRQEAMKMNGPAKAAPKPKASKPKASKSKAEEGSE